MCKSTGRVPIAHPPGSDTRASPQRASSGSMVLTSLRCATLESVSCSLVSRAAHMSGSAAFFAPETRISPESGTPPWMTSLSIRRLFGGERAHRQRVDLPAHAFPERSIDELMALDPALAAERLAHDERLEMLSVADDAHLAALQSFFDVALNLLRCHHASASTCNRSSTSRASFRKPRPGKPSPRPDSETGGRPRPRRSRS